ncbi:1-aminocyclopropane-1-carboxylate deaminase [Sulfurimonas hongkongensis]|uniref:1-aminocyclopropane-1-carboxylate deaminase n=1 Tax=Sulfurimonas hongkongensis TaxID=1172190 RepID=T0JGF8_9BACT|nr:pyridoxal-phosphate dependent enzyme [Sulfurimonas hongkongensis]EQB40145.1 1-aminocyclopropane-1-carboxylate deaminase [Sulfurimonas hongkongensis]
MNISAISNIKLEGREFYVKRDDLIDPYLAGNKYRKLYKLLKTPPNKLNKIISYGGTQSNAMLAIAAMCKNKGWKFDYYTKPQSRTQKTLSIGNYYHSIKMGMNHIEVDEILYKNYIASLFLNTNDGEFVVHQGGAVSEAREGIEVLADEIRDSNIDARSIATPSGTGTTALFLALALKEFRVYTTPCIGDVAYLREQMQALHEIPENLIILEPKKKYHFAKPYKEFLEIYKKLLTTGVEFDLLYAPAMWEALLSQTKEKVLYVHSGGVSGNENMLTRYRKRGFNLVERV